MTTALVFDTGALISYAATERLFIGPLVSAAADTESVIVVPVTCFVEAYEMLEGEAESRLDTLRQNSAIVTTPLLPADVPILGALMRSVNRIGLAHAILETMDHQSIMVTTVLPQHCAGLDESQVWQLPPRDSG